MLSFCSLRYTLVEQILVMVFTMWSEVTKVFRYCTNKYCFMIYRSFSQIPFATIKDDVYCMSYCIIIVESTCFKVDTKLNVVSLFMSTTNEKKYFLLLLCLQTNIIFWRHQLATCIGCTIMRTYVERHTRHVIRMSFNDHFRSGHDKSKAGSKQPKRNCQNRQ